MSYTIKPLPFKPPRLVDLPATAITTHYQEIYGTDARELSRLTSKPASSEETAKAITLASRLALQEAFYDSLGGEDGIGGAAVDPQGAIAVLVKQVFASMNEWRQQFESLLVQTLEAQAQSHANNNTSARWVVLGFNPVSRQLSNLTAETDGKMAAAFHPLIVIDAALANLPDFRNLAADKLAALLINNIHWDRANNKLLELAQLKNTPPPLAEPMPVVKPEELAQLLAETLISDSETPEVLDVCLPEDIPDRFDQVPGATCILTDELAERFPKTDSNKLLVVYCMFGFQVSQQATSKLRQLGYDARLLSGGVAAWRATGNKVADYNKVPVE